MRSFIFTTLLLALTCAPSRAQFNFPSSSTDNNRYPRYPAQSNSFGSSSNPNSIDGGFSAGRYPVTQSFSAGTPDAGLGASPDSSTAGNPNARILGLFGGGGRGGGLFSNLLGALTGANRNPIGGGGAYPYPVPAPFPAYPPYGIPSPYAGGFGYPGFGGGYGNGFYG